MAYTASALSFMLEDLGKTVVGLICRFTDPLLLPVQILTGAQIPLSQLRSDAADNFLGALVIAGQFIIPGMYHKFRCSRCYNRLPLECALFFNHTLYRGNRVSKISSYELNAYDSPNFPPLVDGTGGPGSFCFANLTSQNSRD